MSRKSSPFLDRVRAAIRGAPLQHSYVKRRAWGWILRVILYHDKRRPQDMGDGSRGISRRPGGRWKYSRGDAESGAQRGGVSRGPRPPGVRANDPTSTGGAGGFKDPASVGIVLFRHRVDIGLTDAGWSALLLIPCYPHSEHCRTDGNDQMVTNRKPE